jgi:hypothetical protein
MLGASLMRPVLTQHGGDAAHPPTPTTLHAALHVTIKSSRQALISYATPDPAISMTVPPHSCIAAHPSLTHMLTPTLLHAKEAKLPGQGVRGAQGCGPTVSPKARDRTCCCSHKSHRKARAHKARTATMETLGADGYGGYYWVLLVALLWRVLHRQNQPALQSVIPLFTVSQNRERDTLHVKHTCPSPLHTNSAAAGAA